MGSGAEGLPQSALNGLFTGVDDPEGPFADGVNNINEGFGFSKGIQSLLFKGFGKVFDAGVYVAGVCVG